MSILATLTIRQEDDEKFSDLIQHIDCLCRCSEHGCRRGVQTVSYVLDLHEDCLDLLQNSVNIIASTITNYTTSNLGLKVIDI